MGFVVESRGRACARVYLHLHVKRIIRVNHIYASEHFGKNTPYSYHSSNGEFIIQLKMSLHCRLLTINDKTNWFWSFNPFLYHKICWPKWNDFLTRSKFQTILTASRLSSWRWCVFFYCIKKINKVNLSLNQRSRLFSSYFNGQIDCENVIFVAALFETFLILCFVSFVATLGLTNQINSGEYTQYCDWSHKNE